MDPAKEWEFCEVPECAAAAEAPKAWVAPKVSWNVIESSRAISRQCGHRQYISINEYIYNVYLYIEIYGYMIVPIIYCFLLA